MTAAAIGVESVASRGCSPRTRVYPCSAPSLAYPYTRLIVESTSRNAY